MELAKYPRVLMTMEPKMLHLGHYHGAIKAWLNLQYEHECYFMIADIQALSTNHHLGLELENNIYHVVRQWLACGIDPAQGVIFVQSHVKEQAQLYLLLAMLTPLSWLERMPIYRELRDKTIVKEYDSYGLLGYTLLKCSDAFLYNAALLSTSNDHEYIVQLAREIARRFNHMYGREVGFEAKALEAIKKLGTKRAAIYEELLIKYQQNGDEDALERARFLLAETVNLSHGEVERLFAFLENKARVILPEPQSLLHDLPKVPGIDGQKMSNHLDNVIYLGEEGANISSKIKTMQTDPARMRRNDPGDPQKCPVWKLHLIYSDDKVKSWVTDGCQNASIGCLDCKQCLIDVVVEEQAQLNTKAKLYQDRTFIKNLLADGAEKASQNAANTLKKVREAMELINEFMA